MVITPAVNRCRKDKRVYPKGIYPTTVEYIRTYFIVNREFVRFHPVVYIINGKEHVI